MSLLSASIILYIKVKSQCYASLHCNEYGHLKTWSIHNAGIRLYRDRICAVDFLLHLENKQQIKTNNVETEAYSYLILVDCVIHVVHCYVTIYLHRDFICINIWMHWVLPFIGIEIKDIYEESSALKRKTTCRMKFDTKENFNIKK